jgi:RNA polymerase nonessential primary-like sigma factor
MLTTSENTIVDIENSVLNNCLIKDTDKRKNTSKLSNSRPDKTKDITQLYLDEIGKSPLLSAEEEIFYARNAQNGCKTSRKKMIESNLRFVVSIARNYSYRGMALLDLIEEGNLGLIHAVEKFNPELGFRFCTYAIWWIKQNMERAIINQTGSVRLPVHLAKELNFYIREAKALARTLEHEPSAEEIAKKVERPVKDVIKSLNLKEKSFSIDAPVNNEPNSSWTEILADDCRHSPAIEHENKSTNEYITFWLNTLCETQKEVLARRFGLLGYEPQTLEEVGKEIGVTRERVRQIQIVALERLKRILTKEGITLDSFFNGDVNTSPSSFFF